MITLSVEQARRVLLQAAGLLRPEARTGLAGARDVLERLGCVQLDPLDRVGANADLVLHARVDGLQRGDWPRLLPGGAFEHFAKERCVLPARLFPCYRDRAHQAPWWRLSERMRRLPASILDEVVAELVERGPLPASALQDRGQVEPMDWSGWKGTSRANAMALEVLWTRCLVVTTGRTARGERVYDVPSRALPDHHALPAEDPERTLLLERVRGAGLLTTATGPQWSMLSEVRTSGLVERLVKEGALVSVTVTGARRSYLTLPTLLDAPHEEPDARMRVLGPLDHLLWDRKLVQQVFGFDYVWEVYKPADQRQWGYYVTPLLYRGALVGRMEARRVVEDGRARVVVEQRWGELPPAPFEEMLARLERFQDIRIDDA